MKTKQAFWITALIYFLVPGFFIVFNYSVDPYGRYKPLAPEQVLKQLAASRDEVMITESNYNDRLLLKQYLSLMPKPGTVILGGSRVLNIDAGIFTPEAGRILNAGVSGGTIRDYIGVWQTLKNKKKVPERILLFLDLQSFYSNHSGIGWYSLSCPFLTFEYGRMQLKKYFSLVLKTYYLKTSFHLESLSSSDTAKTSFERAVKNEKKQSRLVSRLRLDPKNAAKTPALAILAPEPSQEESEQSFIDHWAEENGKGEASILPDWNNFKEESFEELASLIADIRAQEVELAVIMMPAAPLSYEQMAKNPKALENMLIILRRVEKMCRQNAAGFYDALHEHHDDVLNTDFKDGVHLKNEAIGRFLSKAARSLGLSFID